MGGTIVLQTILEHKASLIPKVDGVILSCPCLKIGVNLNQVAQKTLSIISSFAGRIRIPASYKGKDLTRDEIIAHAFDSDPLIPKFMTLGLVNELISATDRIRSKVELINVACLFLIAEKDTVVDNASTREFVTKIPEKYKTLIQYSGMKHEIMNEIGREEVFFDIYKWLLKQMEGI